MKLYPDTKIYILCPGNIRTGGPELCHQLASQLITFGVESHMLYYPLTNAPFNKDAPVEDTFKKYHVPYTFIIQDTPHNILIMPETSTALGLNMFPKCRRIIWWMSVDNYFTNIIKTVHTLSEKPLAMPMPKMFQFDTADADLEHWLQSEYARQFVTLNGVPENKIYMVEDYLNQAFLSRAAQVDLAAKKNFVAYNPKKGFEVTSKLIELAPDIDWRPIQNMTPVQVQELLAQAKVYIDFGKHPGRDRIPREAAISGCVVITGKRGAADNDVDINIPAEFKFGFEDSRPYDVIEKIRSVFENFSAAHEKQAAYRARILDDKNRFANEVAAAFEIRKLPPPNIAFAQGISEKTFLLAKQLQQSGQFTPSFFIDDKLAAAEISGELILREHNRNYFRVGEQLVEIITRDDAKFLYQEGRIKKFALVGATVEEAVAVRDFYKGDVLVYN